MGVDITPSLDIPGWMSPVELAWLAEQAQHAKAIIEVGCYQGRSTLALASHTLGLVYAVDPYPGEILADDGIRVHAVSGDEEMRIMYQHLWPYLGRTVFHHRRPLAQLWELPRPDFLFIDGDHRLDAVMDDVYYGICRVKKGGILAGHDHDNPEWPGVGIAIRELLKGHMINYLEGIWWTRMAE